MLKRVFLYAALAICFASFVTPVLAINGIYVRPSKSGEEAGTPRWRFYNGESLPPASQEEILLIAADPLSIAVPAMAMSGLLGSWDTSFTHNGPAFTLNALFYWSGGMTETIYGPNEYVLPIGQLPEGTYSVELSYFWAGGGNWQYSPEGAAAFLADPRAFAEANNVNFVEWGSGAPASGDTIIHTTLDFTVVPEPSALAVLAMGGLPLLRRWRKG
jgi:hypothetical protein